MKKIKLTQGEVALVDNEDFERINQHKWHLVVKAGKYASTNIKNRSGRNKQIVMHRYLMNFPKGKDVDHKNRNGLDNQKTNLRICSRKENLRNRVGLQNVTSKFKGVCWNKCGNKWRAQIMVDYVQKYLGRYNSELEAAKAYNQASIKYHGEFARLNEV